MIESLFPTGVCIATGDLTGDLPTLFPAEERAIAKAVPRRRSEFAYGRQCARNALEKLGLGDIELPVGSDRAPIWPCDVVGSITHCDGFVGAVVTSKECYAGIGFDAEEATPLDSDLVRDVCTEQELAGTGLFHSNVLMAAKLAFCAKESVFKAVYPSCGVWLRFGEVELTFDTNARSFLIDWGGHRLDLPGSSRLSGKYRITSTHFFSGVVLSRE